MSAPLVAIAGPTAVGKSALALKLASAFHGEIISADSRQVYRFMDIGTAKPTPIEQALVPHHLLDLINPDQPFSLAEFQALAFPAISSVQSRGHLPLLVGGTGQYVWAVLENWAIPRVAPDLELRRELEAKAEQNGGAELYKELKRLEPEAAARIDPRNIRRVIRALEISYRGGTRPAKRPAPFESLIIGLTAPRPELYRRIDERIKVMIEAGLADETKRLLDMGYNSELPAMSGIGYRQMVRHLAGEVSLAEAIESMNTDSHRLARQQYNWFKPADPRIHWFDVTRQPYPEIDSLVSSFLARPHS